MKYRGHIFLAMSRNLLVTKWIQSKAWKCTPHTFQKFYCWQKPQKEEEKETFGARVERLLQYVRHIEFTESQILVSVSPLTSPPHTFQIVLFYNYLYSAEEWILLFSHTDSLMKSCILSQKISSTLRFTKNLINTDIKRWARNTLYSKHSLPLCTCKLYPSLQSISMSGVWISSEPEHLEDAFVWSH